MLNVLAVFISIYLAIQIFKEVRGIIPPLLDLVKKNSIEDEAIEEPEDEVYKYRYDIAAFKKRVEYLKNANDDTLYDVKDIFPSSDSTGVEIIPASVEIDIDKYIGRS